MATKFSFNPQEGNPNSGGNGRKNIYRALEGSLRRLKTDYIDLYWMHVWDMITPVEEVVETLSTLVREGKIRYYGFSDVPAWYARARGDAGGASGAGAADRAATGVLAGGAQHRARAHSHGAELGLAVCPWSPLASGFLAGKYTREGPTSSQGSRLDVLKESNNPVFKKFTERNWKMLDALQEVAKAMGRSPAQVALNWVATQPGVTSTIIGATKLKQLEDNLAAIELQIPAELRSNSTAVSASKPCIPICSSRRCCRIACRRSEGQRLAIGRKQQILRLRERADALAPLRMTTQKQESPDRFVRALLPSPRFVGDASRFWRRSHTVLG